MFFGDCSIVGVITVFFFKQKTAYEMRISDWSSDVCSSDLRLGTCVLPAAAGAAPARRVPEGIHRPSHLPRNGRARPARRDDSGTIWWCRPQLCFVRIDRARSRTRRLRLSLDDVGAIVAEIGRAHV